MQYVVLKICIESYLLDRPKVEVKVEPLTVPMARLPSSMRPLLMPIRAMVDRT